MGFGLTWAGGISHNLFHSMSAFIHDVNTSSKSFEWSSYFIDTFDKSLFLFGLTWAGGVFFCSGFSMLLFL